jgi:hypothetical protein
MRPTDCDQYQIPKRIADVIDIKKSYADNQRSDKKTDTGKNQETVDYLFNRFLFIWGIKWANKIADIEDAAREEWKEAIDGLSDKQIKAGIAAARNQCQWPPEIAEFLPLCKGEALVQDNHFMCSIGGCPNPGTISANGGNWICNRHYHEGKG